MIRLAEFSKYALPASSKKPTDGNKNDSKADDKASTTTNAVILSLRNSFPSIIIDCVFSQSDGTASTSTTTTVNKLV